MKRYLVGVIVVLHSYPSLAFSISRTQCIFTLWSLLSAETIWAHRCTAYCRIPAYLIENDLWHPLKNPAAQLRETVITPFKTFCVVFALSNKGLAASRSMTHFRRKKPRVDFGSCWTVPTAEPEGCCSPRFNMTSKSPTVSTAVTKRAFPEEEKVGPTIVEYGTKVYS